MATLADDDLILRLREHGCSICLEFGTANAIEERDRRIEALQLIAAGTAAEAAQLKDAVAVAAAGESWHDQRAGWLAQMVIDKLGGTDDLPAWVSRSAKYYADALERTDLAERRAEAAGARAAAAQDIVRCFMEDFEVVDLTDEDYDAIEKRARELWKVVEERDALQAEIAELKRAKDEGLD